MKNADFQLRPEDLDFSFRADEIAEIEARAEPEIRTVQPRAFKALDMGIDIKARGYHIFVSGAPGTGRRSAVLKLLEEERSPAGKSGSAEKPALSEALPDIVYLCDFRHPQAPKLARFPRGEARRFKKDLHRLVENVKGIARRQAQSPDFRKAESSYLKEVEDKENRLLSDFELELEREGFKIVQAGPEDARSTDIVPLKDGEESTFDDLKGLVESGALTQEAWEAKRGAYYSHVEKLKAIFDELRQTRLTLEERVEKTRVEMIRPRIQSEVDFLYSRHPLEALKGWVRDLERDMIAHSRTFAESHEELEVQGTPKIRSFFCRYGVNIIVDNSDQERLPIVFEDVPSQANLFGSIEYQAEEGDDPYPAYLRIRAGSLLRASGGYLILKAEDVVQEEEAWAYLKRILQAGKLEIQPQSGPFGPAPAIIKPEPVEIDVKIIMIGNESSYDFLYQADQDFQKLFKVCAEFDSSMPRSPEAVKNYISFMKKICLDESLRPLTREGIAAVLEQGVRLSEYRGRLSTRFSRIADLLRESDYAARQSGSPSIGETEVRQAVENRAFLFSLPEEKLGEMILSGEIVLSVSGKAIGRVNGLAVHDRGFYAFGMPAVISAQVAPGASGVINIEGESGLSGEIYDKAVLIVEGFLRSRYARSFPLSITASICFEQSYTAVEGDSASSTAVYALLSAIAGLPLRQDVAVTGSVNQMGQIQPVGGVSEKIEGFYNICKKAGFSGTQGVMIPRQNVVNLTLSREVREAVTDGRFNVWAVSSIDEGIFVLTGADPGSADGGGEFPRNGFNATVQDNLKAMAELMRDYSSA
jgi:lon-related putative ATP-dependent protease